MDIENLSKKMMIIGAVGMVAIPAVLVLGQEISYRIAMMRPTKKIKKIRVHVGEPIR